MEISKKKPLRSDIMALTVSFYNGKTSVPITTYSVKKFGILMFQYIVNHGVL